jgi:polyhydroxyalkanoate synthesis regulator phasin
MDRTKLALAVAAGAFTTTLVGGVALAGIQTPVADTPRFATVSGVTETIESRDSSKNKLKAVLDALVAKGTITADQAEKILAAVKDAEAAQKPKLAHPAGASIRSFIGDLTKATSDYLGMDRKTLLGELRSGKSIADVANGLSAKGKSATELIALLTKTANDRIDAAAAANKITADQAASLKPKIAAEIRSFVERKMIKPMRPRTPEKPSPSPKS